MSDNGDKNVMLNFLAGVGIGALVGAAAALLLAPKSGEETREDLKAALQNVAKAAEDLGKKSGEVIEAAKAKAQQAIEAGVEQVKKARSKEETEEEAG